MNLYRHYKNKFYRRRGVAKHSETLEDFVIYQPRYESDLARCWVRPLAMFEDSVSLDGVTRPRFERVELRVDAHEVITPAAEVILSPLVAATLGQWDPRWFHGRIDHQNGIYLQIAFVDANPVGFKLGYRRDDTTFYSWIGGVLGPWRGLGIASDLMVAQHAWCHEQGYRFVRTQSQNRWRAQVLLNLRHGFDIVGYRESDEAGPKIVFEKDLTASANA